MVNSADVLMQASGRPAIVADPDILGGIPTILGTRIPAATILASLQDGLSEADILGDYPSVTRQGIEAVRMWAATRSADETLDR